METLSVINCSLFTINYQSFQFSTINCFRLSPEYLIAYRGNEDRHEGGQDVEETIREVF